MCSSDLDPDAVLGKLIDPFDSMQKAEIASTIISGPFLLIGYWRGRKHRLSKYLYYLLGVLSPEARHAVIELAVEEAQRAASATAHP